MISSFLHELEHRRVYPIAIGDTVLAELEIARRTLPNDSQIFELIGYIARRRGEYEEGLRNRERALELDPGIASSA